MLLFNRKVFSFNVSFVRSLGNVTGNSYINEFPFPNLVALVRADASLLEFRNPLAEGENVIASYNNHYVIITVRKVVEI